MGGDRPISKGASGFQAGHLKSGMLLIGKILLYVRVGLSDQGSKNWLKWLELARAATIG